MLHFVPGGRIGFKRPTDLKPLSRSWHLLSPDQTLQVEVSETLRVDEDWDARLWEGEPGRSEQIGESRLFSPGIEHRRFRDRRYHGSLDYGAQAYAYRDEQWIGRITASTSTLGSPLLSVPGGQVARWKPVVDDLFASVTIRPTPTVPQALAEHRAGMAVDDLHPRFVGAELILSLAPPASKPELRGVSGSHIVVERLSSIPMPISRVEEREAAATMSFESSRRLPGSRVIVSPSCRGVLSSERMLMAPPDPEFATTLEVFSRTRQIKLAAFYRSADRVAILQALERVFPSISLLDDE